MKRIYALFATIIICCTVDAQQSFWACGRDFINPYPNVTVGIKYNVYYGKGAPGDNIPGFTDVVYANDNGEEDGDETLKGRTCPTRPYNCRTDDDDGKITDINYDGTLKYDVYYPIVANATVPPQSPAIFFFHPGGFSDCSYKDLPGVVHMCEEFALRGFVVFNVEYRRGIITDLYPYTTVQQVIENYRACQDGRGAIRSAFKRQDDGYDSDKYRIKKSQIFLAGMSAGGLIAMNLAYYTTNSQIAKIFPTTGAYTAEEILGPMDADFYYGNPSTPFQTSIKGVLDMWGELPLPKSYFGMPDQSGFFLSNTYNPPLIAFAGYGDVVFPVPINSNGQKVFFSPTKFSESRCLPNNPPYIINHQSTTIYDATMGSTLNMYTILKKLLVSTEMYLDC